MRTYNISPLWRSTIGFDRVFDLVDAARHTAGEANYPPCNVERLSDDRYRISLALAGFSPDEITVTAEQSVLTIEGRKGEKGRRGLRLSRHLVATFQAAVRSGCPRPGRGSTVRQRPAADRVGSRDSGRHEASPDPD
ncbi:HSP20 family molecular chaperone IbpA [Bradyrhizobium diazoefficiens]